MKKSENKPIFVDVKFEESLSKEHCLFIMLELVKNLIYQRRQIPLTFETLKREMQKYYNSFANVRFFLILTFIKVLLLKSNYFQCPRTDLNNRFLPGPKTTYYSMKAFTQ